MKRLFLLAVLAGTVGCTALGKSDFSCGKPPGVSCMDAISVYEATNDPEVEAALRAELARLDVAGGDNVDPYEVLARIQARQPQPAGHLASGNLVQPISQPLPVLEPARVVRIWIAPWEDRKGDLHMPGYIFSEITPRRWSFGESQIDDAAVMAPIQIKPEQPLSEE